MSIITAASAILTSDPAADTCASDVFFVGVAASIIVVVDRVDPVLPPVVGVPDDGVSVGTGLMGVGVTGTVVGNGTWVLLLTSVLLPLAVWPFAAAIKTAAMIPMVNLRFIR